MKRERIVAETETADYYGNWDRSFHCRQGETTIA